MHTLNSAERFSSIKNSMKKLVRGELWASSFRVRVWTSTESGSSAPPPYIGALRGVEKSSQLAVILRVCRLFLKQANFRGSSWKENRKIYNSARLLQKFRFSFSIPLKINTMFMTGYNRPVPRIYDVGIKSLTKQNALFSPKNLWLFPKNLPIWRSNVESLRGKL